MNSACGTMKPTAILWPAGATENPRILSGSNPQPPYNAVKDVRTIVFNASPRRIIVRRPDDEDEDDEEGDSGDDEGEDQDEEDDELNPCLKKMLKTS